MPRRRPRIRVPLLLAVAGVLVTMLAYIFGLSEYQARQSTLFQASDLYLQRSFDVLVAAWCFWVGSSVGSFLNVVAWRMPRGQSINGRSHCPRCLTQLKARDNFPVFGWLALGGRCRTCRLPISVRYPIVEGVVGMTITLVALAEIYRLCLPRQIVHGHQGPFWAPVVDEQTLLTMLYHTVALAVGWAFGLIRMDARPLPARLMWFGLAAMILPMVAYPTLMVVSWRMEVSPSWRPDGLYVDALVRIITALVAATVLGRYLARGLCPAADPKLDPLGESTAGLIDLIAILSIPAIVVGWQAALAVTLLASLIAVGLRRMLPAADALGRFAIAMPIALTIQIVLWRQLYAFADPELESGGGRVWPSDSSPPWVILVWGGIVLLIPFWLRDRDGAAVPAAPPTEQEQQSEPFDEFVETSDEA